jgi:hypothetical protein
MEEKEKFGGFILGFHQVIRSAFPLSVNGR